MHFIGITGGIGAGKSEILAYIRKNYHCEIYLADEVAHLVKQPGTAAYLELLDLLGGNIVDQDGQIDRQAMADRIFGRPELLEKVNSIIHPAVRTYLMERLEEARRGGVVDLFFVEAALLIEGGYLGLVDEMWYVHADERVRKDRLMRFRGYSGDKISQIMARQLSEEKFRECCDFIIDNSGSLQDSCRQVDRRLQSILAAGGRRGHRQEKKQ